MRSSDSKYPQHSRTFFSVFVLILAMLLFGAFLFFFRVLLHYSLLNQISAPCSHLHRIYLHCTYKKKKEKRFNTWCFPKGNNFRQQPYLGICFFLATTIFGHLGVRFFFLIPNLRTLIRRFLIPPKVSCKALWDCPDAINNHGYTTFHYFSGFW